MDFSRIVQTLGINISGPVEDRICPDQYVGKIDCTKSPGDFPIRRPTTDAPNSPKIILILESPHTEEFTEKRGPAKGHTGRMIRQYLCDSLEPEIIDRKPLILVNAIQYQCSIGKAPTKYREKVFRAVWNTEGNSDFSRRIKAIYKDGDLIVCACTKGKVSRKGDKEIRQMVHAEVMTTLPYAQVLRRTHPSAWRNPGHRRFEWPLA